MQKNDQPNVIFLVIDSCSYKQTSLSGYFRDTTPFLRKLSDDSVHYPYAFSQGPISGLSIASFSSSSYAFDHKEIPIGVGRSRASLASVLQNAGYYTALVTANPYYLKKRGYHGGFDELRLFINEDHEIRRVNQQGGAVRFFAWLHTVRAFQTIKEWMKRNIRLLYDAGRLGKHLLTTRQAPFADAAKHNKEVMRILANRPKNKPLYLQVQYMDLHAPNLPPDEFLKRFGEVSKAQQYVYWQKRNMRPLPSFSMNEVEDLKLLHNACLAHIDWRIQEVIEELKRLGMYEDSIIIVTADHGEAFFEHGDLGHHAFLNEENVRVPLLIKFPQEAYAGLTYQGIVSHIDIAPTILDIAGIPFPLSFVGESLGAVHKAGKNMHRDHSVSFIADRFSVTDASKLDFRKYKIAIRTKDWKLIIGYKGPEELYQLNQDPEERQNLVNGHMDHEARDALSMLTEKLLPYINRVDDLKIEKDVRM